MSHETGSHFLDSSFSTFGNQSLTLFIVTFTIMRPNRKKISRMMKVTSGSPSPSRQPLTYHERNL